MALYIWIHINMVVIDVRKQYITTTTANWLNNNAQM